MTRLPRASERIRETISGSTELPSMSSMRGCSRTRSLTSERSTSTAITRPSMPSRSMTEANSSALPPT